MITVLLLIKLKSVLPALFILPPEYDSTNKPLKRALVRKFTTKRPWSLIRMLVGYRAPAKKYCKKHTGSHRKQAAWIFSMNIVDPRNIKCNNLTSWATYPEARPAGGCRCRPSTEWRCRTRTWAAAPTAGQSAASHQFPQESGTHMKHREARAASHRTGPG